MLLHLHCNYFFEAVFLAVEEVFFLAEEVEEVFFLAVVEEVFFLAAGFLGFSSSSGATEVLTRLARPLNSPPPELLLLSLPPPPSNPPKRPKAPEDWD